VTQEEKQTLRGVSQTQRKSLVTVAITRLFTSGASGDIGLKEILYYQWFTDCRVSRIYKKMLERCQKD